MRRVRCLALRPLLWAGLIVLLSAAQAEPHEGPHQRPKAQGPIDPRQSFPFLVVSGAGGHFHPLLLSPAFKSLFAGTHIGLFRSDDRGLTWRLAASRFSGEEVHALARDPWTGALYAATHRQGLLWSRDGMRWRSRNQGLPGRDLHALALDPRHPERLYAWVVGHGLFRSDEGGRHWQRLAGAEALSGVESLAVHPELSGRLYAGTARGVWVSENGGTHWQFPRDGLAHATGGVSVPPWAPDRLFAAALAGAFVGSADGRGWTPLPSHPGWWGVITSFAFVADMPDVIFAVTHEGVVATLRLSEGNWRPLADPPDPVPVPSSLRRGE